MFTVDTGVVDTAASQLSNAADGLRDVDVAGPFAPIEGALPGSRTAAASLWVSSRLGAAVQVCADRVDRMSQNATATAESYRQSDAASASRTSGWVPR
jgi:hypothetical protein